MKFLLSVLVVVLLIGLGLGIYGELQPEFYITPTVHMPSQEQYEAKACHNAMVEYNKHPTKSNDKAVLWLCDGK